MRFEVQSKLNGEWVFRAAFAAVDDLIAYLKMKPLDARILIDEQVLIDLNDISHTVRPAMAINLVRDIAMDALAAVAV